MFFFVKIKRGLEYLNRLKIIVHIPTKINVKIINRLCFILTDDGKDESKIEQSAGCSHYGEECVINWNCCKSDELFLECIGGICV